MTTGYTRILNIKDLGGLVIQAPLSPVYQEWNADEVLGKIGELTLVYSEDALGANPVYRLPPITAHGQMCAIKNLSSPVDAGTTINVEPSIGDDMFAGIGAYNIGTMIFSGNVGEAAFFISYISDDGSIKEWHLLSYLPGSTYAP